MMDKDVLIKELVFALKLTLRRLRAREKYAAGYRLGRVPDKVFDELDRTRDAEAIAQAAIDKAKGR